jgi:hypothetical protein
MLLRRISEQLDSRLSHDQFDFRDRSCHLVWRERNPPKDRDPAAPKAAQGVCSRYPRVYTTNSRWGSIEIPRNDRSRATIGAFLDTHHAQLPLCLRTPDGNAHYSVLSWVERIIVDRKDRATAAR